MHYKNGREAKVGDHVVKRLSDGTVKTGVVVSLVPGATACNIGLASFQHAEVFPGATITNYGGSTQVVSVAPDGKVHNVTSYVNTWGETASDFLHVEDALKAFEKLEAALP